MTSEGMRHRPRENRLDAEGEARIHRTFRHAWHPVIYSHELGPSPQRVFLCGEQLVVARLAGKVCTFADLCAHRGAPLSLGSVEGGELRCAYHGWQYDGEGRCTLIPQKPEITLRLYARIKKYQAVERYGLVWVCLVDEPRFPLPEFPQFDDPALGLAKMYNPTVDWNCSAPRRIENYVDLGHFPILHDGLLGSRAKPGVPDHRVWREGRALRMELMGPSFVVPNSPRYASLERRPGENFGVHRQWWLFMPLTILMLETGPEPDHVFCLFFHPSPLAAKKIRNFTVSARNYGTDAAALDELREFNDLIYEQDRLIVEGQRPEEISEDLSDELHVKGVDTFSVEYRRWLVELAGELDGR